MYHQKPSKSKTTGQTNVRRDCDLDFTVVETFTQTLFLTVDSDPSAEHEWQQFNCDNPVRGGRPDFLKSLQSLFKDKQAGQYLVKVEVSLEMTTLDFEPQRVPEVDLDLEEAAAASYADYDTQESMLNTVRQTEADETSELSAIGVAVGSDEFDPERYF